jgi:flagella basal body P-ring formation protein FlgA
MMSRLSSVLLLCLPVAANAAILRTAGTLGGPIVHLSDLWDDVGAQGARALGPAPPPGGHITVGSAQLGAIARAYGVDWQPQSDADEVNLQRAGAPLALQSVLSVLRPALLAQGAGSRDSPFDIALPFFDPPVLDAQATPRLSVEQLSFDAASGQFSAILVVATVGPEVLRLHLAGTVAESVAVVVPTRRLLPGEIIGAEDVQVQFIRASLVTTNVARELSQAIGLTVRQITFPGQPLAMAELEHPICVQKGDRLVMSLTMPGLDLGAIGEALQEGAVGDRVAVRNPVSGSVLMALITGPGRVRIDPDAAAVPTSIRSSFSLAAR